MRWLKPALLFVLVSMSAGASNPVVSAEESSLNRILSDAYDRLELARSGQYGWMTRRQLQIANAALETIEELTAGKSEIHELSSDDRRELEEARGRIDQILRAENKNRIVCQRAVQTGSRVTRTVCMTVGQREERARNARRQARQLQGSLCVASEASVRCPSERGQ